MLVCISGKVLVGQLEIIGIKRILICGKLVIILVELRSECGFVKVLCVLLVKRCLESVLVKFSLRFFPVLKACAFCYRAVCYAIVIVGLKLFVILGHCLCLFALELFVIIRLLCLIVSLRLQCVKIYRAVCLCRIIQLFSLLVKIKALEFFPFLSAERCAVCLIEIIGRVAFKRNAYCFITDGYIEFVCACADACV